jgi:hypothetical protein
MGDTTISHVLAAGWTHQLTAYTQIGLRGGPRFSDGSINAEVSASIRHQLKLGTLSLEYSRTQDTVAGQAGVVNTDSLSATASYRLLKFLQVSAAPGFSRSTRGDEETNLYGIALNAVYKINEWLTLNSVYQFRFQQGNLTSVTATTGAVSDSIYHNIFSLGLSITYPYRAY